MTRHHLPHAAHPAPLGQNVTSESSEIEQSSKLTSVTPRAFIFTGSLDQKVGAAEEELALEVRDDLLAGRRGHGGQVRHGEVHPVQDLGTDARPRPLSQLDVTQPVQAGQVQDVEL